METEDWTLQRGSEFYHRLGSMGEAVQLQHHPIQTSLFDAGTTGKLDEGFDSGPQGLLLLLPLWPSFPRHSSAFLCVSLSGWLLPGGSKC